VGLQPDLYLRDAPTLEMHRARIPNVLFKDIIGDIEIVMKQYGPPMEHNNVEAMSRFFAPVGVSIFFHNSCVKTLNLFSMLADLQSNYRLV
jgi:hypothetical protein